MSKPIGTLGTIPTLTVGGRVLTDLANLIELHGYVDGATNTYGTPRKPGASAGYTPSGANKFRIVAMRVVAHTTTGNLYLSYGDNDVGVTSASAATNTVYIGADANLGNIFSAAGLTDDPKYAYEISVDFLIPNTKYPQVGGNAGSGVFKIQLYGYEEA